MKPDKNNNHVFEVIGIMSGTSLDGIDLAHCTFIVNDQISYTLNDCETIPYTKEWKSRLKSLPLASAEIYAMTHAEYGRLLGNLVKEFIDRKGLKVDLVSSHGHTIFHQPSNGFTSQIGEGAALAAACGKPVICDFRTTDVSHGGQGAPLVPAGDEMLFGDYSHCLNLGGFANISFRRDDKRLAFDICPVNYVLNHFARLDGSEYDPGGSMAEQGALNNTLLDRLNAITYYKAPPPKSLGREWVEKEFLPLIPAGLNIRDILNTLTEHIAIQIGKWTLGQEEGRVLVTGGGAFNNYLMQRIRIYSSLPIHIPDDTLVNYKEALVFALLGVMRIMGQPNCLASVTGADRNVTGGAVYLP